MFCLSLFFLLLFFSERIHKVQRTLREKFHQWHVVYTCKFVLKGSSSSYPLRDLLLPSSFSLSPPVFPPLGPLVITNLLWCTESKFDSLSCPSFCSDISTCTTQTKGTCFLPPSYSPSPLLPFLPPSCPPPLLSCFSLANTRPVCTM